jgi:hypothetical protein
MKFRAIVGLGVCALVASYASSAVAEADPTCVPNAAAVKKACKAECTDDFLTTKFAVCRGLDPDCVNAAVAAKLSCIDTAKAPLDACFETCTDPDPVANASCRDGCRGVFYTTPGSLDALKACRSNFRAQIAGCPRL